MIQIPSLTVAELHQQLQAMIDQGLDNIPVIATDCRAFYPFSPYTVCNSSGSISEFVLSVRPDAHFAPRNPLPINWTQSRVSEWNTRADAIKASCGAFSDSHLHGQPSRFAMKAALERIWNSANLGAHLYIPEVRGLTGPQFAAGLVRIAGEALGHV